MSEATICQWCRPPDGHETVEVPPTPEVVESPFGKMIVYESLLSDFSIQAPMDWIELWPDEGDLYLTLSASTPEEDSLIITEGDFLAEGEGEKSLEEVADEFELAMSQEGMEISSRKEVTTSPGVPAIVSEFTLGNGLLSGLSLLSLQEERFFIYIVYLFTDDTAESVKPLAEYTFDTLLIR